MGLFEHLSELPSPCYVVDEKLLRKNLLLLQSISQRTGCRILLAQKAFSMYSLYPLIGQYLNGTTASSLHEARLGKEEMGGETHIFAAAYRDDEMADIIDLCDHIVFNSFSQWQHFRPQIVQSGKAISCGLRINPACSTQEHAIYDPCSPGSRLGVTLENFQPERLDGLEGLHFHTLCEQNADALLVTLQAVEKQFGTYLHQMKWLNFGGGHHITRDDYDVEALVGAINHIQNTYGVQVYLEPGEAVVLNTGFLVCSVLDIVHNGLDIAILDTSAECHMPDVIEMPYHPHIIGSAEANALAYTYRLAGPTCLAGDIIGDYSFEGPLAIGDHLIFTDMALYTMVKNNTFNGINLPAIVRYNDEEGVRIVKQFGYDDFKSRLS